MKERYAIILLLLLVLLGSPHAVTLSNCTTISSSGVYEMNQSFNATSGSCLNIIANNIIVNGNGFTIGFDNTPNVVESFGIHFDDTFGNVTIRNMTVYGYGASNRSDQEGIETTNSTNVVIEDLKVVTNSSIGMSLHNINNSIIRRVNVTCNNCRYFTAYALRIAVGSNNTIADSYFTQNVSQYTAMRFETPTNLTLSNLTIYANGNTQVVLISSSNILIKDVNFSANFQAISFSGGMTNFTIENASYSGSQGILRNSNAFANVTFIGGNYFGTSTSSIVNLVNGNGLRFINSNFTKSLGRVIQTTNISNIVAKNTFFYGRGAYPTIDFTSTNNSNFSGNVIKSEHIAITFNTGSMGNTFWNNSFNVTAGKQFVYSVESGVNGNAMNYTTIGNRYFNTTEIGSVYRLNASFSNQPWSDSGADRPLNQSNMGVAAWNSSVFDWFPWTNHIGANVFIVNLTAPANNATVVFPNVTFSAVALSPNTIVNSTLWANFSGVWSANVTQVGSANFNQSLSSLSVGSYSWNVLVCDTVSCIFDSLANRTVNVVYDTAPIVNLTNPSNGFVTLNSLVVFEANFTSRSYLIANSTLFTNASGVWSANVTQVGIANFSQPVGLPIGVWVWNVRACDQYGQCSFDSSGNRTVVVATAVCVSSPAPQPVPACFNSALDKALIPEKSDDSMLPIIIAMAIIALIFAFLYFSTPSQQGSITADAFRMLFLFLSLWSVFGTAWFAYHYAVDGAVQITNFSYVNMTSISNSSGNVTTLSLPVINQAVTISGQDTAAQGVLVAYLQATMWAIIVVGGLTLAAFLMGVINLLIEALKPKKKFGNKENGG